MTNEWYYSLGDEQKGPVSPADLKMLATSGELSPDHMVWKEGMAEWKRAGSIKGLFADIVPEDSEAEKRPPTPPPRKSEGSQPDFTSTPNKSSEGEKPVREKNLDRKARETVQAVAKTSEEVSQKLWFLDLKFETFATPKLLGFAFLAWMILALVALAATAVQAMLRYPALQAILGTVACAASLILATIIVRVFLESLLIAFRIAEHLKHLETIAKVGSEFQSQAVGAK